MTRYMLHPVPDELRTSVAAIWTLDAAAEDEWVEVVPATFQPDLVLGNSGYRRDCDGDVQVVRSSAIDGVTLRPRTYRHCGDRLTGVQFRAGGLHAIVSDVSALRDEVIDLKSDGIWDDADPIRRADAAAKWVKQRLVRPVRGQLLLDTLAKYNRVSVCADVLGVTVRSLHRHVRRTFGMSPKEVQRLARFHRAVVLVDAGWSLAAAAFEAGYADQPHFCRECRLFTGSPPTAALR